MEALKARSQWFASIGTGCVDAVLFCRVAPVRPLFALVDVCTVSRLEKFGLYEVLTAEYLGNVHFPDGNRMGTDCRGETTVLLPL